MKLDTEAFSAWLLSLTCFCTFSLVRRAAPMAPISPGYGARKTSTPRYCSSERNTASFLNVPPCTTIFFPRLSVFEIRTTLVNTFSIMERQSPAIMSSGPQPFFCSVIIVLFIKTVQRLPKSAGFLERKAASAILSVGIFNEEAKFSRKEPQPDEQASFNVIFVMIPSSIQIPFIS